MLLSITSLHYTMKRLLETMPRTLHFHLATSTNAATMGNDGGVIAVKRKFMRHGNTKARGEKADAEEMRAQRTQLCALSGEPLREPVVACALGNLYNKQALLEQLLAKTLPARFRHISVLRDVVECHFTTRNGRRICPVSLLEFNGGQPFVVLPACGCVVAERSLREVRNATECLACGAALASDAAAPIALALALDDAEYERRQRELLDRKTHEKQLRKTKKTEKHERKKAVAATGDTETKPRTERSVSEEQKKHQKEEATKQKKRKAESQSTAGAAALPPSKIVKDAASAIEREKAKSAVFASLFSTDKKGEKKSANELLMTIGGLRYTLS